MQGYVESRSSEPEPVRMTTLKCPVCGSPSTSADQDGLCWVCRRLKISAWRDADSSLPEE